jgi:hypothetical protein
MAMDFLFAGKAEWTALERFLTALALGVAFFGQAIGLVGLVPVGAENAVYVSNLAAAVVGAPLLVLLARATGVAGALTAVCLAEALLSAILVVWLVRVIRRPVTDEPRPATLSSEAVPPPASPAASSRSPGRHRRGRTMLSERRGG